jgi:hypothetical protein
MEVLMEAADALDFIKADINDYLKTIENQKLTVESKFLIETQLEVIFQRYERMGFNLKDIGVRAIYSTDAVTVDLFSTGTATIRELSRSKQIVN